MPRGKAATSIACTSNVSDKIKRTRSPINKTEAQNEDNHETDKQTMPGNEAKDTTIVPNLSQFKFEKKSHVKIEFEGSSPVKEEPKPKGLWEPANWQDFLLNLRNMRANYDAPVDSMGCHMSMDHDATPEVIRYQSLISLMLSSQTKDQVTFAAMERLRAKGLTIDNILKMSDEELGQLIYPVGFWRTKVKYIKKTTQTLKEQYNGDIPDSAEKLCKLTGVGPKMAHICMSVAWGKITGIGVDTHVHRISNRIGWVKKPTSTPEDTRKSLETWLPFDLWSEVNHLMVGFGQTICLPIGPLCHECLNRDICPSSGLGRKSPNKKSPMKNKGIKEEDDFEPKKDLAPRAVPAKSPSKRKVTPNKNETSEINVIVQAEDKVSENKAPRNRKVTPKNIDISEVNIVVQNKDAIGVEKSPRKRKITPKHNDDSRETLTMEDGHTEQKSPRKRKVTPKNIIKSEENIATQDDGRKENFVVTKATNKKSPKIRKVTIQKEIQENSDSDFEQVEKISKNYVETKLDTVTENKPKKRSPRTKKTQENNVSENVEMEVVRKTRGKK